MNCYKSNVYIIIIISIWMSVMEHEWFGWNYFLPCHKYLPFLKQLTAGAKGERKLIQSCTCKSHSFIEILSPKDSNLSICFAFGLKKTSRRHFSINLLLFGHLESCVCSPESSVQTQLSPLSVCSLGGWTLHLTGLRMFWHLRLCYGLKHFIKVLIQAPEDTPNVWCL